jgi:AmmeMemoRadiSam system protein B
MAAAFAAAMLSCSPEPQVDLAPFAAETARYPAKLAPVVEREVYPAPESPGARDRAARAFAGTVSHHLLAADYIDGWFVALAASRRVDTFVILTPAHWTVASDYMNTSLRPWQAGNGLVEVDGDRTRELVDAGVASLDDTVFEGEHGISSLVPFIEKHFPDANLVQIATNDVSPQFGRIGALAEVLRGWLADPGVFFVASTDFSHHLDPVATAEADASSRRFFAAPGALSSRFGRCDNPATLYLLGTLAEERGAGASILYHTTSYEISGVPEDVTSYFFTYFGP